MYITWLKHTAMHNTGAFMWIYKIIKADYE